jgi:hypothetical protein
MVRWFLVLVAITTPSCLSYIHGSFLHMAKSIGTFGKNGHNGELRRYPTAQTICTIRCSSKKDDEDWDEIGEVQNRNKKTDGNDDDERLFVLDEQKDKNERKFTGAASGTASSLFSPNLNRYEESESTIPSKRKDQNEMQVNENEIRLVNVFERTLPIQFFVLVLTLCWTVYIGLTGGITDGSDRNFFLDDDFINDQQEIIDYSNSWKQEDELKSDVENVGGPSIFL